MMEPHIQYARTSDGVNIAFWTLGEGAPLVAAPSPGIPVITTSPWAGALDQRLARHVMVVNFDGRGTGFSDRDVRDFSLEAHVRDLEAVLDALGAPEISLWGNWTSAPIAIAEAVRRPHQVSHLVLWQPYARNADFLGLPHARALNELAAKDWELYTETMMHTNAGWSEGAEAHRGAVLMQEAVSQQTYLAALEASMEFDATPLLQAVRCPTLILQHRQMAFPTLEVAKGVAASIPLARLRMLEGSWTEALDAMALAVEEFVTEGYERATSLPSGTAVILFADIAGSTGLTERLGDGAFRQKARDLDSALRSVIRETGGVPVEGKLLGDGVLAVFTSARQAIEAALCCGKAGDEAGLPLHLGIHAGDVISEENNVYGGAVNIAARIAAASAPGEVLVSDTVRGLARTSAAVLFADRGERELKGVGEPQRLWAVREGDA